MQLFNELKLLLRIIIIQSRPYWGCRVVVITHSGGCDMVWMGLCGREIWRHNILECRKLWIGLVACMRLGL